MDRDNLKKILLEQFEPLENAVQKKLAYLASDDVFSDDEYQPSKEIALEDAFSVFVSMHPIDKQPHSVNNLSKPASEIKFEQPTAETINNHKHNIAAKIAALRGISLPGDYLNKKY